MSIAEEVYESDLSEWVHRLKMKSLSHVKTHPRLFIAEESQQLDGKKWSILQMLRTSITIFCLYSEPRNKESIMPTMKVIHGLSYLDFS